MIRVLPFAIYLLLVAMHEVIWKDVTMIFTAAINLPALLVLLVALYKSEIVSTWFGFAAGVVTAAGMPGVMGWHALVLAFLGLVAFHARERMNLDSLNARLFLIFGGILVHNVLSLIIRGGDGFTYLLWSGAVTGAAYTTVIAWLFFLFKEDRITYQKIRSLF